MTAFVIIGMILTLAGLGGILWCIRHASWLRRAELSDDDARTQLNKLIFGHMASIGAAFMGLGLLVVGYILS